MSEKIEFYLTSCQGSEERIGEYIQFSMRFNGRTCTCINTINSLANYDSANSALDAIVSTLLRGCYPDEMEAKRIKLVEILLEASEAQKKVDEFKAQIENENINQEKEYK